MKHKPSKKTITEWIADHVRPHVNWSDYPDDYDVHEESSSNIIEGWKDKIKNHVVLGVKFKWRF
jgi:hypothetical protein